VKVQIINKSFNALPEYALVGDSGMDLRSDENDIVIILPGERTLIKTGLFVQLPDGYEFQIRPKSGMALKYGITVLNTPGSIDANYRGEIGVILHNASDRDYAISPGDKVAQMVLQKVPKVEWEEVEKLSETNRGDGGYGHTGN
jgi:dUTP pyrophosphatase